jgi:hypothetical protein
MVRAHSHHRTHEELAIAGRLAAFPFGDRQANRACANGSIAEHFFFQPSTGFTRN